MNFRVFSNFLKLIMGPSGALRDFIRTRESPLETFKHHECPYARVDIVKAMFYSTSIARIPKYWGKHEIS